MIVDMRIYTYEPALFSGFVRGYVETGHAIVSRHLGTMAGVFMSASGIANRTLQLFGYENHDHRDVCRNALRTDPAWGEFIRGAASAIRVQENTILKPTACSPVKNISALKAMGSAPPERDRLFEMLTAVYAPGTPLDNFGADREAMLAQFLAATGQRNRVFSLSAYISGADQDARSSLDAADAASEVMPGTIRSRMTSEVCELWQPLSCSPLR